MKARAVDERGRLSKTVVPVGLPNAPSCHIWKKRPKCPAVSGVAALVPFHTWLPDAYLAAPAPISAILSGVVSKVLGLYVLARLLFNVFGVSEDLLLLMRWAGGITMVAGGLLALSQWDIKRLFAYSSISQVGLILLSLGFGTTLGAVGAIYHLVNHAVFKPLLFLNSGQVEDTARTPRRSCGR